uniref:hypothetical protein n=1 Tax=uncultured Sphingomonas sp. TaxID=158754 RepID=UPI0035CC6ADB
MSDVEEQRRATAALDYAAYTAEASERVRFQISLVERGIQSLMYMNGGALVALFTLLGSKAKIFPRLDQLWVAFGFFVCGLAMVAITNYCAFISQIYFAQVTQKQAWDAQRIMAGQPTIEQIDKPYRIGVRAQTVGMVAALLSLATFVAGCGFAFLGALPR